jgi:hypothetical protein
MNRTSPAPTKQRPPPWGVGDEFESIVKKLQAAGVAFEHYDMPGLERQGDIHVADGFRAAWFKDPDGNILHINSMQPSLVAQKSKWGGHSAAPSLCPP